MMKILITVASIMYIAYIIYTCLLFRKMRRELYSELVRRLKTEENLRIANKEINRLKSGIVNGPIVPKIVYEQPNVRTLNSECSISLEHYRHMTEDGDFDEFNGFVKNELCRQLAASLQHHIDIEESVTPYDGMRKYKARLRILTK